jgi:predicted dienelactone hydrolase
MKHKNFLTVAMLLFCSVARAAAYEPPKPSQPVAILRETWHDAARNRDVPVKIYYPEKISAPCPVIIFSHGLGGSCENYEYLGRHWAGCGYVSVHIQHLGSDDAVWKNAGVAGASAAMRKSVLDVSNALNRAKDVSFAIDQITRMNGDAASPLHGRLDLANIGMAGHSFGGWTTMAVAGQKIGPMGKSLADPRIKAAIEMSAPVPRLGAERAVADMTTPMFHMTGTLDDSPLGDTKAGERRVLFDKMKRAETCLVIFNGADHMTFSGHVRPDAKSGDEKFHALILSASTAFWDAYLRGDGDAKHWLYDGGYSALLGKQGTFEKKLPSK